MSRRPLIAGNWKMNKTPQETEVFIEQFLATTPSLSNCDVLLIPPFTSLDRAGRLLSSSSVFIGAQDVCVEESGAFTGAISAGMLQACGCRFVLAGHSERRHIFGDLDEDVSRKLQQVLCHDMVPILCVGETLDQRRADQMEATLKAQLSGGLMGIRAEAMAHIVIAYEPVWAIGTGETASPVQAQQATAFIRDWLAKRFDGSIADATRILYGGSVKPSNAQELQAQPDIDGALIGGASLNADSFVQIIAAIQGVDAAC